MNRKKVEQQTKFTGENQTRPPVFKQIISNKSLNEQNLLKRQLPESLFFDDAHFKRPRVTDEEKSIIFPCFEQAMFNYLHARITSILKGKNAEKNLKLLEEKLSCPKRLPSGIITDTAKLAKCNPSTVSSYLDNNSTKKNEVLWKEFFEKEYETALIRLKKSIEPVEKSQQSKSVQVTKKEVYRTLSVSINKLYRSDIHNSIKEEVIEKLKESQRLSSDYIMHYSMLINLMILKLRSSTPKIDGNSIVFSDKNGLRIADLLPEGFIRDKSFNIDYTASPISSDIIVNQIFKQDYDLLFQEQHLGLVHSYFFGARGAQQSNINEHPVQQAFFKSLATHDMISSQYQNTGLSSAEMSRPRELFITNLANMWESNANSHVLVARTVEVLLKIHLAPQRYKSVNEWKNRKQLERKNDSRDSLLTRNQARNVVRAEHYKIKKYEKKNKALEDKWDRKIKYCYKKINVVKSRYQEAKDLKLKAKLDKVDIDQDETNKEGSSTDIEDIETNSSSPRDISRRRITALKSIVKHLLFNDNMQTFNEEFLKEECYDITTEEIKVCLMILKALKPYIPLKANRFTLSHQLPLYIVCNDILAYTSNTKYTRKLCPTVPSSHLQALSISAASLFQILTKSSQTPLILFGYDNFMIESESVAIRNKDAIFNSIFDMKSITNICESYKVKFADYITLLPGLKTARILGTKLIDDKPDIDDQKNVQKRLNSHPIINEERQKTKELLMEEVKALEIELKDLSKEFEHCIQEDKKEYYSDEVKKLKSKWDKHASKDEKTKLYHAINNAKFKRDSSFINVEQKRFQLKSQRQALHFKRVALRISKQQDIKPIEKDVNDNYIITKEGRGIQKAENCRFQNSINISDNFTFSGTDNGVKTMSTSVGFSYERFLFHLDLYKKQSSVDESDNLLLEEGASSELKEKLVLLDKGEKKALKLKPVLFNAEDLDISSGHRKSRKNLEISKKSNKGKEVQEIERLFSENSVLKAIDIDDAKKRYSIIEDSRDTLRKFYNSNKRVHDSRCIEIKHSQAQRHFCAKERRQLQNLNKKKSKKKLIMLIGDRGTGQGSAIKGYRRYGGRWKEEIQGQNTSVSITNEHNTSKFCVYCFSRLDHPTYVRKKGERVINCKVKGSFLCRNRNCILVQNKMATQPRDASSSLAIGLSGLAKLTFGATFPCFEPKLSKDDTNFKTITSSFLNERERSGSNVRYHSKM